MNQPLLTIGMVVRNGQAHLDQAIASLRAQTFCEFALVVYDNASSDETPTIVAHRASADPRIRLVRHEQNIGALANFVAAARETTTPYFCWATHDDVRTPTCLARLIGLLEAHPWAGLACCAARDMDPDGTLGPVRPETAAVMSTRGLSPTERLRVFLPLTPCTPVYGVYRTKAIQSVLPALEANARPGMGAILAGDIVFLAAFLREHHVVATPEPLLHFRRGGFSHDVSRFKGMREWVAEYSAFSRRLRQEARLPGASVRNQALLWVHRTMLHTRILTGAPVRRMIGTLFLRHLPWIQPTMASVAVRTNPEFRRLVRRLRRLPRGSQVAIFGAGLHTRRNFARFQAAFRRAGVTLTCAVDDRASQVDLGESLPVVGPDELCGRRIDVLIVSSDTYERAMALRALEVAGPGTQVWTLYDTSLEIRPRTPPVSQLPICHPTHHPAVGAAA